MKPLKWRMVTLSVITLLAIYSIIPTIIYFLEPKETRNDQEAFQKKVPSWLPQSHIKLGLDLQGGIQLVIGVDTQGAIDTKLARIGIELKSWGEEQSIPIKNAYAPKNKQSLHIVLEKVEDLESFRTAFKKDYPNLKQESRDENKILYTYSDEETKRINDSARKQAERVVRQRVDGWGVLEAQINTRSDGSIMIQLPGFRDPKKAKSLLGRTAQLEFKIVDEKFAGFASLKEKKLPEGITKTTNSSSQEAYQSESREELEKLLKPLIPEDRYLSFKQVALGDGSQNRYEWTSYVLEAATYITGEDIADAVLAQGQTLDRTPVVSMRFTGLGGKRFAKVTGDNVKRHLAIVLDGLIESDPIIEQKISGGDAQITLRGSGKGYNQVIEEGQQLALILKSGAIPATLTFLEERQVGASLGPELANQGIKGILFGLLCVLIFMLLYYRRPGVVACIALILNSVLLLAAMSIFGFALTLPGIAGFVLTLGMAVDANVLINERIRQEIREGRHPRRAIESAFGKVFWTIMDANITTLLAAFVLLETNPSGPIRGFSITLIIGLSVSLFTSLYFSRFLFDIVINKVPERSLKKWIYGKLPSKTKSGADANKGHIDFLKSGKAVTVIIALIGFIALATTFSRGMNLGVDFTGGTEMMIGFQKEVKGSQLRAVAKKTGLDDVTLQVVGSDKRQYLLRYDEEEQSPENSKLKSSETIQIFKQNLANMLKDFGPEVQKVDSVGPQVGKELRTRGVLSIIYAILAVILYIAFRFDMRFSPGALIKMFLDILVILGFYVFFQIPFDLTSVAALLTVVGYSVNDTIVIYDRIRENLVNHGRRPLSENINLAINETLSRSINTALTTIISLTGILIFASGQIWYFAMAMSIGVFIATLSSIFTATSFILWFEQWKNKRKLATR